MKHYIPLRATALQPATSCNYKYRNDQNYRTRNKTGDSSSLVVHDQLTTLTRRECGRELLRRFSGSNPSKNTSATARTKSPIIFFIETFIAALLYRLWIGKQDSQNALLNTYFTRTALCRVSLVCKTQLPALTALTLRAQPNNNLTGALPFY